LASLPQEGEVEGITSRTMTYLTGKPEGDKSMSLKQTSQKVCMTVRSASPVRMVKLPVEPESHAA
jgi:hypothetical protein